MMAVLKDKIVYGRRAYFEPFVSEDGRVGYRVQETEGDRRETFIYLNPAVEQEGDSPEVFLYVGGDNDPAVDQAEHWYGLDFDGVREGSPRTRLCAHPEEAEREMTVTICTLCGEETS